MVHLAAVTGRAAPADYRRVNVDGTRALLRACTAAKVRRFVHMSTIAAAYAEQRYYPYAKSKSEAEALVRDSGMDFSIIRPTLVLGARSQSGTRWSRSPSSQSFRCRRGADP